MWLFPKVMTAQFLGSPKRALGLGPEEWDTPTSCLRLAGKGELELGVLGGWEDCSEQKQPICLWVAGGEAARECEAGS